MSGLSEQARRGKAGWHIVRLLNDVKRGKMREELKWLAFASIAIGVVIVGLLILTFVPGLGWTRPSGYGMWNRTDFLNPWDFLANVTIALLMLAIPLSHIAWLVMAAIWLARSAEPSPGREALNCTHCGGEVQPGWKACPYCGEKLGVSGEK
jgi:hypothetical protein